MKSRVRIVLRSGYSFSFCCDELEVRKSDNEITGYTIAGATCPRPMYLRLDDVSAVINEGPCEDGGDEDVRCNGGKA
jgi:hypothetical protein